MQYRGGVLGLSSLLIGVAHQGAVTRFSECGLDGSSIEKIVNIFYVPEGPKRDHIMVAYSVLDALEKAHFRKLHDSRRRINADDLFYGVRQSNNPIVERVMEMLQVPALELNPSCPREICS